MDVDAAAFSLVFDGANVGTFGASDSRARVYDEMQFVVGEGPCLDAVARCVPVMVADLADAGEHRWPAYGPMMIAQEIRGVYAMPVAVAGEYVGALDFFRTVPGDLSREQIAGMAVAAELVQLPLLDLLSKDLRAGFTDPSSNAWADLNALSRTEVSQATGMLMAQLNLTAASALARLRAHAYASGRSATSIARDIIDRRLFLEAD
ncbi:antitermination regulator [Mycolicibacterium sphagni]|uniref:Antitermination regulator n=2 Tax=Mycolicibacterium sphagni TaxID=1786 RepID=A0A255DCH9_9MYCO|nr:GAF domain-containing protein [Mycolicibacterium sphagni]OYN77147.1 antitermination regulator [Mycolicibacterium sphagni]